jgi:hypothetical protein
VHTVTRHLFTVHVGCGSAHRFNVSSSSTALNPLRVCMHTAAQPRANASISRRRCVFHRPLTTRCPPRLLCSSTHQAPASLPTNPTKLDGPAINSSNSYWLHSINRYRLHFKSEQCSAAQQAAALHHCTLPYPAWCCTCLTTSLMQH